MTKLFIWDFHGVLEKGNDYAVLEITNLSLQEHGYSRRMTEEESLFLTGRRWHEYFAYLLPELKHEHHFSLQASCFEISKNNPQIIAKHVKVNDHVDLVLEEIHQSPHCQILISNSLPVALDIFIKTVSIDKFFPSTHRFGAASHTQNVITKQSCLDAFMNQTNGFEAIITIGDSPGDMALKHPKIKTKAYLYSHPERLHRPVECDYKINDLRLVLKEI